MPSASVSIDSALPSCTSVRISVSPSGFFAELRDERAVDLERVDGELLEVGERGVAGAEVVDRDAHAELLDRHSRRAVCSALRISVVSVISIVSARSDRPLFAQRVAHVGRRTGRCRAGAPRR
jgi:hypothetical protein